MENTVSFSELLAQSGDKLYTPYYPSGNPEEWSAAYRPLGLPHDPAVSLPLPGLESAITNYSLTAPFISSIDGLWDKITQNSESAVSWAYQGAKSVVSGAYQDVREAVGTVAEDVTSPISGMLKTYFWYLMAGLVVVGGVVYYAGKGGAIKVNANV